MAKKKSAKKWIQAAVAEMQNKGTQGSFGPATAKNIAAGKKKGGKMAKKAVFAQNMAKIAKKKGKGKKGGKKGKMPAGLAAYWAKKNKKA